jgi:hypothetical protein
MLTAKILGMQNKLQIYNQLVEVKHFKENSLTASSASTSLSNSSEKRILSHFSRQLKQFLVETNDCSTKMQTFQSILESLETFGPETKDEVIFENVSALLTIIKLFF